MNGSTKISVKESLKGVTCEVVVEDDDDSVAEKRAKALFDKMMDYSKLKTMQKL